MGHHGWNCWAMIDEGIELGNDITLASEKISCNLFERSNEQDAVHGHALIPKF
jgi:hypothetical protein